VPRDAGLKRGELYPLFDGKDDLVLLSVDWVAATWDRESATPSRRSPTPPRRC
jgi:hypothetical protein